MAYVKMVKNVGEGGIDFDASKKAVEKSGGKPPKLKFGEGAVVPMSDASAVKYIELGLGKVVELKPAADEKKVH